jgi:hypothetical protein
MPHANRARAASRFASLRGLGLASLASFKDPCRRVYRTREGTRLNVAHTSFMLSAPKIGMELPTRADSLR